MKLKNSFCVHPAGGICAETWVQYVLTLYSHDHVCLGVCLSALTSEHPLKYPCAPHHIFILISLLLGKDDINSRQNVCL